MMLLAAPAWAQTAPPADGPITCTSPVSVTDSAKSLMQRYGQEAVTDDQLFTGVEDITYQGVVLSPKVPDWRIEIGFADETMRRVSRLTLIDSRTSHWNVAGVTLGSTLAEVQKINGRPFLIREFFTDGGGFVVDWKGGTLSRPLPVDAPSAFASAVTTTRETRSVIASHPTRRSCANGDRWSSRSW
ncbi:hypothetical protein [Bradyrhizobium sp. SZCCHNRI1073]|uniref:hypothetical protein n=1 Tax=Bradyrhizobium sp. SZCCHNRI1073 TaxID=3057280 RepID=UPI002915F14A|nr:hypothetical protein [Bradyrhizobium sp. SZCCHNRI1073]